MNIIKKERNLLKKEYYVYIYLDPRKSGTYIYGKYDFDHQPIYVGKGKRKRAYYFERRNFLLRAKLEKFEKPIVFILGEKLTEQEAFSIEKDAISSIGLLFYNKGPLCNLTTGGEGPSGASRSKETREKISKALKGIKRKPITEETRSKLKKFQKGRARSKEYRIRISEGVKRSWEKRRLSGEDFSEVAKIIYRNIDQKKRNQKISEALKGRTVSEETKRKISESSKNKKMPPFSEEWKRNISLGALKRKPISEESRMKMSKSQTGKHLSEETKKKLSEINSNRSVSTRNKISENMKRIWNERRSKNAITD